MNIWVDFPLGSTIACPVCDCASAKVYDSEEKNWRDLNFFQYRPYLHARVPRAECPGGCGVRQIRVPWARPRSEFTLYFEGLIMLLAQDMTVKAIAELVGEHKTRPGYGASSTTMWKRPAPSRIIPESDAWA